MTRARDVANIDGILTTTGDTYYASAAATPARLGIGSTGQVLTVAGGVPTWAAAGGGGKVLQVVMGNTTTSAYTNTNTFIDTNLTATITPTSASSKVLVLVSQNGCERAKTDNPALKLKLKRGATDICTIVETGMYTGAADTQQFLGFSFSISYLDSPATTSPTTYKTQFNSKTNAGYIYVQSQDADMSTIILLEIGA